MRSKIEKVFLWIVVIFAVVIATVSSWLAPLTLLLVASFFFDILN